MKIYKKPAPTRASALLVVIALLGIIGALAMSNSVALAQLNRNIRIIEKRQIERVQARNGTQAPGTQSPHGTNQPTSATPQIK